MAEPVLVAIISAATSIFASALTFFLTKKKEHEADWRKQKLESYKELLSAMNGVSIHQPSQEARTLFAHSVNNIMLVASPPVLVGLRALLDDIESPPAPRAGERHDELLTTLMYAVRQDLGVKPNRAPDGFRFKLSAAPPRAM